MKCTICGKEHVKLWHPFVDTVPLLCASCAEERQVPRKCDECVWEEKTGFYVGNPTGKKLPLPKWTVDEKGKIPSHDGPGPDGSPFSMTDLLLVDLKDVADYSEMTLVPAVPNENGIFIRYPSEAKERYEWWESLPTR